MTTRSNVSMRRCMHRFARARAGRGFMLLEVIVSLVILGISVATIMRSFTLSMNAIRRNDVTTQACVLAEGMLQDLELNPPKAKLLRGDFADQGFPNYSWELRYEEEELRYRELRAKTKVKDLKPLRHLALTIYYQTETMRSPYQALETHLYLPPIERFRFDSKFYNELFREEDRR